jgi:hypothetical protein
VTPERSAEDQFEAPRRGPLPGKNERLQWVGRLGSLPKGGASRPACRAYFNNRDGTRKVAVKTTGRPQDQFEKKLGEIETKI